MRFASSLRKSQASEVYTSYSSTGSTGAVHLTQYTRATGIHRNSALLLSPPDCCCNHFVREECPLTVAPRLYFSILLMRACVRSYLLDSRMSAKMAQNMTQYRKPLIRSFLPTSPCSSFQSSLDVRWVTRIQKPQFSRRA